jgi:hypothetical protein
MHPIEKGVVGGGEAAPDNTQNDNTQNKGKEQAFVIY